MYGNQRVPSRHGLMAAWAVVALLALGAGKASAAAMTYTDEASFLADLGLTSYSQFSESFEEDSTWGGVRIPNTAPSVLSQGITWSTSAGGEITTGSGAARTGDWGLFALPHGNPVSGPDFLTDRLGGTSAATLYAAGGFVRTNTPFADVDLLIDGLAVDFNTDTTIGTGFSFFGVIDDAGFTSFEFVETEGAIDDQKFIFADDFRFATAASAVPMPEPATAAILSLGLVWLGARRSGHRLTRIGRQPPRRST